MKTRKTSRTVHVTVSVPRGLKQKMSRHQEKNGITNWSKVARQAFRNFMKEKSEDGLT
jgi:metal-responsive CopG/Arc/MetJ family transcriptional regulator